MPFDLASSMRAAEARFATPRRRRRCSAPGIGRLPVTVRRELARLLDGQEPPRIDDVVTEIGRFARARGLRAPSRATVYNFLPRCPSRWYPIAGLPTPVRDALYNLDPDGTVPGHQLAFYAFQYGDLRAASFAAGLPWLALYQADLLRGWRDRSRGLLRAAMQHRGIR